MLIHNYNAELCRALTDVATMRFVTLRKSAPYRNSLTYLLTYLMRVQQESDGTLSSHMIESSADKALR